MALWKNSVESIFEDGYVTDSALPSDSDMQADNRNFNQSSIRIARVDEVSFTDEKKNTTANGPNPIIEYNCSFVGGVADRERVYGVRDAVAGGGKHNKNIKVRKPIEPEEKKQGSGVGLDAGCNLSSGKSSDQEKDPERTTGDFVLLACIDSFSDSWVIIQDYPHPLADKKHTKEDGFVQTEEYNGVVKKIDKDGNLTISQEYGGPRDPKTGKGKFEDEATEGSGDNKKTTKLAIDNKGKLTMTDKNDTGVTITPSTKKMDVKSAGDLTTEATRNVEQDYKGFVEQKIAGFKNSSIKGILNQKSSFTTANGGGTQMARLGDSSIGFDSHGVPVRSNVVTASKTFNCS